MERIGLEAILDDADFQKGIAGYTSALDRAESHTGSVASSIGNKLGSMGHAVTSLGATAAKLTFGVAVAGAAALTGALGYSVNAAMEAAQVHTQLVQVLESTGGASGMTVDALDALANSLAAVTPVEDDAISAGEAMLLTFTNIGSAVFPQATETLLDMATAMNSGATPSAEQLKAQAIQLGKALNDPVAGLSALQRVGVSFTEAQKAQIAAMVEAGNVAGAQAVILQELQKEFGGSARAAGETLPGQLTILKNSLGNVAETIGGVLLPGLTSLAGGLVAALNGPAVQAAVAGLSLILGDLAQGDVRLALEDFAYSIYELFGVDISGALASAQAAFQQISDFIAINVVPVFTQIAGAVQEFVAQHAEGLKGALIAIGALLAGAVIAAGVLAIAGAIAALANPITLIVGVVALLGMAWTENWGGIQEKTQAVLNFLQPYISGAITFIQTTITSIMSAVSDFWIANGDSILASAQAAWATIQEIVNFAVTNIQAIIQTIMVLVAGFWQENGQTILTIAQTVWSMVQTTIETAIGVIQATIALVMALIRGDWGTAWQAILDLVTVIWNGITAQIGNALTLIQNLLTLAYAAFHALTQAAWSAIQAITSEAWAAVTGILSAAWSDIQGRVSRATADVQGAITNAWNAINGITSSIWATITGTLSGAWEGIQSNVSTSVANVRTDISTGWDTINSRAQSAWGVIQTTMGSNWSSIVSSAQGRVDDIRVAMGSLWYRINSAAAAAWGVIRDSIAAPIQAAQGIVQSVVDTMRGALESLGTIHIPLPHFRASTHDVTVAGITFPVPDIGVDWYARGLDAIVSRPTIIGVGEAGPERVIVQPLGSAAPAMPDMSSMWQQQRMSAPASVYNYTTVNNYWQLSANYASVETETSLRDTVRLLQMGVS